jgi:hypothetical protein
MIATGQSFAERFARWDLLLSQLKQTQGLTHLAEDQRRIEELLAEARTLEVEQEGLRGASRKITARLRVISKEGDTLRSRVGAKLQGEYGFRSEELIRFGFKPRQIPRRRKKEEPPPPGTTPPQPSAKEAAQAGADKEAGAKAVAPGS